MICAIIQARMGSTRLPGKVLKPLIGDKTTLELLYYRASQSTLIDKIIVATTTSSEDDAIADKCKKLKIDCFRGSQNDVLDRYFQAAKQFGKPKYIVRLTGDCPLHDATVIDQTISGFVKSNCDYGSNGNPCHYPDGLDVEIFTFQMLKTMWKNASLASEREHVTPYAYKNKDQFSIYSCSYPVNYSHLRWTLDEPEDYNLIKKIYHHFGSKNLLFSMQNILKLIEKKPELATLNTHIKRNEGYKKSLKNDPVLR